MKARGRPKTSQLDRTEQLRRAKRRQRARERAAGLRAVQLNLPPALAAKLAVAARARNFPGTLDKLLDQAVIRIADYPLLQQIAWSRTGEYIPAEEALGLYERNWRFVDPPALTQRERALIDELRHRFGGGILHA
jgi:hypothetical protein